MPGALEVDRLMCGGARGAGAPSDAQASALRAGCERLALRLASESAAAADAAAVLRQAGTILRISGCEAPRATRPALAWDVVRAAILTVEEDTASAHELLGEPWLSFLASLVDAQAQGGDAQDPGGLVDAPLALGAAWALLTAKSKLEAGELGSRGAARLSAELLKASRVDALLRHASLAPASGATPTHGLLSRCCRGLLDALCSDLGAREVLLRRGALPVLLRAAQAEGAADAGLGCVLSALSASSGFAQALAELPSGTCVLVNLAAAEVGPSSETAGAASVFCALLNACRASEAPALSYRLAEQGAASLLAIVVRAGARPLPLRLEAAEALCRLLIHGQGAGPALPPAALQGVATPATVSALVSLCEGRCEGGPLQASRGQLRHRLLWLLAGLAREASAADLEAWTQEAVGVRSALGEALRPDRSGDVHVWAEDLIVAMCGRLAPDVMLAFLRRGPAPLLAALPELLRAERPAVRARAVVVVYWVAGASSPGDRPEVLAALPVGSAPPRGFWPPRPEGALRQLAEVAVAAAATVAAEAPPGPSGAPTDGPASCCGWGMLLALCRLVVTGMVAAEAISGVPTSQACGARGGPSAALVAWLDEALRHLGSILASAEGPRQGSDEESLTMSSVLLFADLLDGPLRIAPRGREHDVDDSAEAETESGEGDSEDDAVVAVGRGAGEASAVLPISRRNVRLLEAALLRSLPTGLGAVARPGCEESADSPATSLLRATRRLGRREHGRLLTRLVLHAFSSEAADDAVAAPEGCARAGGASTCWQPLPLSRRELGRLDAFASTPPQGGERGREVRRWDGGQEFVCRHLCCGGSWRGLCAVLCFLDQRGSEEGWQEARLALSSCALRQLAASRGPLLRLGLGGSPVVVRALVQLAAGLLAGAASGCRCCLQLHVAMVALLDPTHTASPWPAATSTEALAYLWALVHVAGVSQESEDSERVPGDVSAVRHQLGRVVAGRLAELLAGPQIAEALCYADDNAMALVEIRWALDKVDGALPLFAGGRPASGEYPAIDLQADSWCPPGRILLAALVLLGSLALRPPAGRVPRWCVGLLSAAVRAGVLVLSSTPHPGSLIPGASDVLSLLRVSAPLAMAQLPGEADTLRYDAGKLLVVLLHRPPIEALLAPRTTLDALVEVPDGLQALRWCAACSAADLRAWGARARALLATCVDGEQVAADCSGDTAAEALQEGNGGDHGGGAAANLSIEGDEEEEEEQPAQLAPARLLGQERGNDEEKEGEEDRSVKEEDLKAAKSLRAAMADEVASLDAELESVEAELEAALAAERADAAAPLGDSSAAPHAHARAGPSAERASAEPDEEPTPGPALPPAAQKFLAALLGCEGGLGRARDAVLGLLQSGEERRGLARFQAYYILN